MFVSYSQKKQVRFSQETLEFMDDYKKYEKSLILAKNDGIGLKGKFDGLMTYLQEYNLSLAVVLSISGLFFITNHLSNGVGLLAIYIVYHYVKKKLKKKERLKELELNKLKRNIFYRESFLKSKKKVLTDLYEAEDDLGIFSYYQKKDLEGKLSESDMENIVSLLKTELEKQRKSETSELQNFVRKYQS